MSNTVETRGTELGPVVLSTANLLTYLRIALVPAMVAAMLVGADWGAWLALSIFIVACVTDFLDGYVARAWGQQSRLGAMLDPIADKLLVAAALMVLASTGVLSGLTLLAGVVIISREILVSGLREFLGNVQVSLPVSNLAKWKTTLQMVAIGFLIAGEAGDKLWPYTTYVGSIGLWIAAMLTIYTGWDYWMAGVRHVVEEDARS